MVKRTILAALVIAVSIAGGAPSFGADPGEIVAAADRVRNPDRPVRGVARVIAYKDGKPIDMNVFTIYSKIDPASGQFRDIVVYNAPPRDAGKIMLFKESYLWFYDPSTKDSIRISPQQRLIGQANAGDVLELNFAVDYHATLLGTQSILDANSKQRNCWHLNLAAINNEAIYNRIEYWVEQGTNYPVKAKFFSDSGRLIKILYYRNFEGRNNGAPEQAVILDSVDSSLVTTVDFSNFQPMDIPESWFQKDYLPNLKTD